MAQFTFHCTRRRRALGERRGAELADLVEAHERALSVVRSVASRMPSRQDWRDWLVRVTAETGEEVLVVPFVYVLGRAGSEFRSAAPTATHA